MKGFLKRAAVAAGFLPMWVGLSASVADSWPIPGVQPAPYSALGASMPYTRLDFNDTNAGSLNNGATLKTSPDWDAFNKATQASNQAYVALPVGGSMTWRLGKNDRGDGVTVRYTIKDSFEGEKGQAGGYAEAEGHLVFKVGNEVVGEVDLSSYYMYQYFTYGSGSPSQSSGKDAAPSFCFDERHVRLSRILKEGDELTVECTRGEEVGVDFVELEVVPDPIDPSEDAGGRAIFNVADYGAKKDTPSFDNRSAFEKAFKAASAVGGIMYVPEGTWYMGHNGQGGHGILSLTGKNVKVTGAGIWHTNIQFTGWEQFGGGISGGNPANCGGNVMDNIEWCHMYINSNLSDRHGENAVYKCFMDIWCAGSVIHDVWEQHFECGLWFGDYNSSPLRTSEVKVINCRIRDNYADGVNFCRGTSHSTVYNCSVRNNGDDGLACWDDPATNTQDGNTFCYNTIDFIWRAGAIAIYGGVNQHVYDNYLSDTFMASGIHCNDIFSRKSMDNVLIEENVLVRCGTLWESWGRDYAAIDCEGNNTAEFRNNYLYDCPAEALRIKGSNDGVVIDGLYVNGAGVSKGEQHYSSSPHQAALANIDKGSGATVKNFHVVEGSVPEPDPSLNPDQLKNAWPFWDYRPETGWGFKDEDEVDWAQAPPYPDAVPIEPPVDYFANLTDYDVVLTGIDWITNQQKHSMYDGDKVTLSVRIDNKGKNSIPAEAKFTVRLMIDGTGYDLTVKDGLAAGSYRILEFPTEWLATKGMHTFAAVVDPAGKFTHETDRSNNSREKDVNVNEIAEGEEPEIEIPETGVTNDLAVLKVWFENETTGDNDEFAIGDRLSLHALIANVGKTPLSLGSGKGVLWSLSPTIEYMSGMVWDDQDHYLAPGDAVEVTPNGGGNQSLAGLNADNTYTVKAEDVTLYCRLDNPKNHNDGNSDNDANSSRVYSFPTTHPVYNDNPDRADRLDRPGEYWDYEDNENTGEPETPVTGFDLVPEAINWTPAYSEIRAGSVINDFTVRVANRSNVDLPEGKTVRLTFTVGSESKTVTYTGGIEANDYVDIEVPMSITVKGGGYTVRAVVSPISGEADRNNNERERTFNVLGDDTPAVNSFTTGYSTDRVQGMSVVITKVEWAPEEYFEGASAPAYAPNAASLAGQLLQFAVTVYNNGSVATPANTVNGILIQTDNAQLIPSYWGDGDNTSIQPGETRVIFTNGGSKAADWGNPNDNNYGLMPAVEGTTYFNVTFDDQNRFNGLNRTYTTISHMPVVIGEPEETLYPDPTGPDNLLDNTTAIETITGVSESEATEDVWYTLQGIRVNAPTIPGIYIHNGRKELVR